MNTQIAHLAGRFFWVITEGEVTYHSCPYMNEADAREGLRCYLAMRNKDWLRG